MRIVLLQDVPKVGHKYEVKDVAAGYALNFLIPRKLGEVATQVAVKRAEAESAKRLAAQKDREDLLIKSLKSINDLEVKITGKTNDKGHLFAGIHKEQLIPALAKQIGLELLPEFIILEKPIKEIGKHKITVRVGDKSAVFNLVVENKRT